MSEAIDFYQKQALNSISKTAWMAELQKKALAEFCEIGFPMRGNEDWKYTRVDSFLKQLFKSSKSDISLDKHALEVLATGRQSDAPIGIKIPVINGFPMGLDGLVSKLPAGVIVKPLATALLENSDKIKPYLNQILETTNGFQSLNTAMIQSGLFIYIPENIRLPEPLLLSYLHTSNQQATFLRNLIVAEKSSEVTIIEDYQGESNSCYHTNAITEVFVDDFAVVKHYKVQRESKQSFHYGHIAAKQQTNSQFSTYLLNIGGQWARCDTTIDLAESSAKCILNGIYMPTSNQHMDHQTEVNHLTAGCDSSQDYRGIVTDQGRAIFNGKIFVEKYAKQTVAHQQNKNLLLSSQAEVDTKPQLDIYSDDVVCTHGATVGQLDEDALFYFTTRGIDEDEGKKYLLQAFAADNIQAIENKSLSNWMSSLLIQQMG
ncbi:MAG: Fe-S cluster assembly protein SufD [Legionellaceae bacterium]|nr:Fe-S cluster assembly protein SufD [Legionellaceae bacterium]